MAKDYYKILGVDKDVDPKDLKSVYRQLAKKWHPDANLDNQEEAEEKFKEISEAYSVLSDPDKKAMYDATGSVNANFGNFTNANDLFDLFRTNFNMRREANPRRKGQSLQVQHNIDLCEALFGGKTTVSYQVHSGCQLCYGKGGTSFETCSECKGSGYFTEERPGMMIQNTCPVCAGSGNKVKDICGSCSGRGAVIEQKKVSISIPAGIKNGNNLRLQGQGGAGFNGGPNGDILVLINVLYPSLEQLQDSEKETLKQLLSKEKGA